MKNLQVGKSEKQLIDNSVARLLSDMRGVEPPLPLAKVRDLLRLDLAYYSSKDPGMVSEVVHSLKIAGKEMLSGKTILGRMIDKLGLRAMFFWDQGRILVDKELHPAKHRWAEGHEIGHRLSFWHKEYLLGDSRTELDPGCHATIEAEANYAAGQLLFMQRRFIDEARSLPLTLDSLKVLAKQFGNSNASTLWRLVEECGGAKPLVGIVSDHPHRLPAEFDHTSPCRHVIESPAFKAKFSKTSELQLFDLLKTVCSSKSGGPLGTEAVQLIDNTGRRHEFVFESFCYRYKRPDGDLGLQVLTLGVHARELAQVIVA